MASSNTATKVQSETPNLDRIQESVDRLHALLHDRHPGLSTWREALQKELQDVNQVTGEFI